MRLACAHLNVLFLWRFRQEEQQDSSFRWDDGMKKPARIAPGGLFR